MKTEVEIRELLVWLKTDDPTKANDAPEPETFPEPGYIYFKSQAIDVLKWVLDE